MSERGVPAVFSLENPRREPVPGALGLAVYVAGKWRIPRTAERIEAFPEELLSAERSRGFDCAFLRRGA